MVSFLVTRVLFLPGCLHASAVSAINCVDHSFRVLEASVPTCVDYPGYDGGRSTNLYFCHTVRFIEFSLSNFVFYPRRHGRHFANLCLPTSVHHVVSMKLDVLKCNLTHICGFALTEGITPEYWEYVCNLVLFTPSFWVYLEQGATYPAYDRRRVTNLYRCTALCFVESSLSTLLVYPRCHGRHIANLCLPTSVDHVVYTWIDMFHLALTFISECNLTHIGGSALIEGTNPEYREYFFNIAD